jgi:hypothetical protein
MNQTEIGPNLASVITVSALLLFHKWVLQCLIDLARENDAVPEVSVTIRNEVRLYSPVGVTNSRVTLCPPIDRPLLPE